MILSIASHLLEPLYVAMFFFQKNRLTVDGSEIEIWLTSGGEVGSWNPMIYDSFWKNHSRSVVGNGISEPSTVLTWINTSVLEVVHLRSFIWQLNERPTKLIFIGFFFVYTCFFFMCLYKYILYIRTYIHLFIRLNVYICVCVYIYIHVRHFCTHIPGAY